MAGIGCMISLKVSPSSVYVDPRPGQNDLEEEIYPQGLSLIPWFCGICKTMLFIDGN